MPKPMDHATSTMTVAAAGSWPAQRPQSTSGTPEADFKHVAIGVGVLVVMVGLVAYGFYIQQSQTEARQLAINQEIREVSPSEAVASVIPATAVSPEPAAITPAAIKEAAIQADAGPFHADVYFDFGKSRLRADATATLQRQ